MAISWEFEIEPINIPNYEAKVIATRTEDDKPDRVYELPSVTLKNTSQQLQALDRIWDMHIKTIALETAATTFLTGLAAIAKANMEARE